MKTYLFAITLLLISLGTFAQPQGINYQGVARDSVGHTLINSNIALRLSILDGSASGSPVYVETHNTTTSSSGLFNLSIGTGTVVSGVFANIAWGQGNKWLKIEMDVNGGSIYQLLGTTQFMSVPYAMYANISGSGGGPSSLILTFSAKGTTLSLTTGATDIVTVWAKGDMSSGAAGDADVYLKYNTVQKDIITIKNPTGWGTWGAFALEYTETPGAGTHDITVTTTALYSLENVVIIAQVVTPVSGASASSSSLLLQQLVSYWKLDGNSIDAVGSNNGTDNSITYSSGNGKIIQGAGFNGTTSDIQNSTALTIPTNASISCWFKTGQLPSGANPVLYGYRFPNNNPLFDFTLRNNSGHIDLRCGDNTGTNEQVITSGNALNDGNWHFIAGVKSGGIVTLYVDGLIDNTISTIYTGNFNNVIMSMGHFPGNSEYYNGDIDECGFWSRALTAGEISTLYNSGSGLSYPF